MVTILPKVSVTFQFQTIKRLPRPHQILHYCVTHRKNDGDSLKRVLLLAIYRRKALVFFQRHGYDDSHGDDPQKKLSSGQEPQWKERIIFFPSGTRKNEKF